MRYILFFFILCNVDCFAQKQQHFLIKADFGVGLCTTSWFANLDGTERRLSHDISQSANILLGYGIRKKPFFLISGIKVSTHSVSFKFSGRPLISVKEKGFSKVTTQKYICGHIPLYIGYKFQAVGKRKRLNLFTELGLNWSIPSFNQTIYEQFEPQTIITKDQRIYVMHTSAYSLLGMTQSYITYHYGLDLNYQLTKDLSLYISGEINVGTKPLTGGVYDLYIGSGNSFETGANVAVFSAGTFNALKTGVQYRF